MFWLFGFLRMGSSGLTAQAYGAGDRRGAQTVLARSLLLALLIGIAMIAAREPVCSLLFDLLDVDGSTASVARSYFMIVVWSAPAVLGLYSLTGWVCRHAGLAHSNVGFAVCRCVQHRRQPDVRILDTDEN